MNNSHNIFSSIDPAEYAEVAVLARLAGESMLDRLALVSLKPKVIVDVGAGTGWGAERLQQRYPAAQVLAFDNVLPMLQHAKSVDGVCADALSLPLKDYSVDLIFANLFLPWCEDWNKIFREWRRILKPEGLLMFTCFGPDTLREVEGMIIPRCVDMHEIGDQLTSAKFSDPVMDVEYLTFNYQEMKKLISELKTTGMVRDVEEKNQSLTLTYEIVYGHAFGPSLTANHVADEEGIIKIPLAHLRYRKE